MTGAVGDQEDQHAAALERRYLIRFEEDMLRSRPLSIRLIIEFLGTFLLVTVVAGAGVINHYAGGHPVTSAAAAIAAGGLVMALIYAWGPLSGLHINPAVTLAFYGRGVFPLRWVGPTGWRNSRAASAARCSCRPCSPMSPQAGPTRSPRQAEAGGRSSWRSS